MRQTLLKRQSDQQRSGRCRSGIMAGAFFASVALLLCAGMGWAQPGSSKTFGGSQSIADPGSYTLAQSLGITFVDGSTTTLLIERNGTKYLVNLAERRIGPADPAPAGAAPGPPPRQDHAAGEALFHEKCSSCHGQDGKGIARIGTPNFTDPKVQAGLSDQEMTNIINHGKKGTLMPAWAGKLSDSQIAGLVSFLRSLGSQEHKESSNLSGKSGKSTKRSIYTPPDDYLYSLPTGRKIDRHGFYFNFTHRFAFDPAFSGSGRGNVLFGLDGFALASFGLRYGITDKLSVSAYRSPSILGRPIELGAAYRFLDEHNGNPVNAEFRFSVDGQNDFAKNFTTNFEGIFSRSLLGRAQIYVVPTLSLQNRRLISKPGTLQSTPPTLPGINSFSLGVGGAFDIRPTVALIAEVMPTLVNGPELGIHRPAFGFGIQKRIWRHAFTLGFSNSPGTIVSQRAGTRATFIGDPSGDTGSGLFIGFDLMRQIH